MRNLLIGIITIAVAAGGFFYYTNVARASIGNLNIYDGTVELLRGSDKLAGKTGTGVRNTDILKVGPNSRVSIILKDGSVIRLEADSEVEVTELTYDGDNIQTANFRLISGKMWSKVEPLSTNADWQVETPTAVASVRGTAFNTRYSEASTGVSVYLGKVGVALLSDLEKEKLLNWGDSFKLNDASLEDDFAKDPTKLDPEKFDEWVIFNLTEDKKIDNSTFVPPLTEATTTDEMVATPVPKPQPLPPVQNEKKLIAVSIIGNKSIILVNEETRVRAVAKYSDNSNYEIPFDKITWLQRPKVGTLTSPGYYSSSKPTTEVFQAQFENIASGPITITVKETLKVLKRIEIAYTKNAPQSRGEQYDYTPSQYGTVKFTATAYYDSGPTETVTSGTVWSVTGSAGGSIDGAGLYTPLSGGSALVEAVYKGEKASVSISIP